MSSFVSSFAMAAAPVAADLAVAVRVALDEDRVILELVEYLSDALYDLVVVRDRVGVEAVEVGSVGPEDDGGHLDLELVAVADDEDVDGDRSLHLVGVSQDVGDREDEGIIRRGLDQLALVGAAVPDDGFGGAARSAPGLEDAVAPALEPGAAPSTTAISWISKLHWAISAGLATSRPMVRSLLLLSLSGLNGSGVRLTWALGGAVSTRILAVRASAWSPLR